MPIDAVVTSEHARDFLHLHGYVAGLPLHLPSGPRLWPLRRSSSHAVHPERAGRDRLVPPSTADGVDGVDGEARQPIDSALTASPATTRPARWGDHVREDL
ncbi:hypothetical protein NKG94_17245 [Micromonospora sp. M12]